MTARGIRGYPPKGALYVTGFDFNPMREDTPGDTARDATARPRDLVDRPDMFGLWGKPMRAAADIAVDDARFIAANVQHWVANAIREQIAMERSNLATLLPTLEPTSPEMTFDRVAALRRGDIAMTLPDLLVWARRFDSVRDILTSTLDDRPHANSRLTPPSEGGMGPVISTKRAPEPDAPA